MGAKPLRTLNEAKISTALDSLAVTYKKFSNGAGQLHFVFDIGATIFARISAFNSDISANCMGRAVQRVFEHENYRLLALFG